VFYALTYLVMFALPIVGVQGQAAAPAWVRLAAASGFLMTMLYVVLSIVPIVEVQSRFAFALKVSALIVTTNLVGLVVFAQARKGTPR
jgi:hypothetical protein